MLALRRSGMAKISVPGLRQKPGSRRRKRVSRICLCAFTADGFIVVQLLFLVNLANYNWLFHRRKSKPGILAVVPSLGS